MAIRKSHSALSIDTNVDYLGWPWSAISSNALGISHDFADLRANVQNLNKWR